MMRTLAAAALAISACGSGGGDKTVPVPEKPAAAGTTATRPRTGGVGAGTPALPARDAAAPDARVVPTDAGLDAAPGDAAVRDAGDDSDASVSGCASALPGAPPDDPYRRVRTTSDLPDDAPDAYQIHLLYVEPSDRSATPRLDEDGSIRRSTTAWSAWLAARTGGPKLRIDRCGGVIDVTYVKLPAPLTEAELARGETLAPSGTVYLRDRLEAELKKTFHDAKKIYLVYYDGLAFGHCGGAPLPPLLQGHFPALFLGGLFSASYLTAPASAGATELTVYDPVQAGLAAGSYAATLEGENVTVSAVTGTSVTLASPLTAAHPAHALLLANTRPPDCRSNPFSRDATALGYTDYSAAHELLHTLGIVGSAAKYHSGTAAAGHLTEASAGGTSDLMYQGTLPWTCSGPIHANPAASPCVLDPAHENYWQLPPGSAAVDLSRSVFVEPRPTDAQLPPGW